MAEENKVSVLVKSHVRDPETHQTFFAGSYELEEGQAARLVSYHAGLVEETSEVATDAAVEVAQEKGVDIANVEGSGSGGRVTRQDVEKASR